LHSKWSFNIDAFYYLVVTAIDDHEPLNFDFPNEDIMVIRIKIDDVKDEQWTIYFDTLLKIF
jgi:hypothetical protein